jgi:hypothetical protein
VRQYVCRTYSTGYKISRYYPRRFSRCPSRNGYFPAERGYQRVFACDVHSVRHGINPCAALLNDKIAHRRQLRYVLEVIRDTSRPHFDGVETILNVARIAAHIYGTGDRGKQFL